MNFPQILFIGKGRQTLKTSFVGKRVPFHKMLSLMRLLDFLVFLFFFFFLRKISPELTSAANPPLFAEEDWP